MSQPAAHPSRAAILSVGDELVLGQTLDTNSRWLSQRLRDAGVAVTEHVTLGDDLSAFLAALRRLTGAGSAGGVDVVIITGGLGPTADDLTRDAIATLLDEPLVEDAAAVDQLRHWFTGRDMPVANLVQARRPRSAMCLPNPHGTAPGLFAESDRPLLTREGSPDPIGGVRERVSIFCLPGPPREMQPMFDAEVLPRLRRPGAPSIATRVLPCFGLGESEIARRLGGLMDRDREARGLPLVGTTASQGVVSIRIRATGEPAAAVRAADEGESECRRRVGDDWILGRGEISLAACVLDLLRTRGQTLAVAESCTGGLLGSMLTDIPGSSDSFVGGWITYANAMKTARLGVAEAIITQHGAVSRECALAMARGALQRSGADHGVAITGIAGPGGGSESKPVGTVWIGLASRWDLSRPGTPPVAPSCQTDAVTPASIAGSDQSAIAHRFQFAGDRANIRTWAAQSAMGLLRLRLIGRERMPLMRQAE